MDGLGVSAVAALPRLAVLLLGAGQALQFMGAVDGAQFESMDYSLHTIYSTECKPYFDWQSLGVYYSFRQVGMPGKITRLSACEDPPGQGGMVYKDIVPTYIHRNFANFSGREDWYVSYNKPGSAMDWLEKNDIQEEWILFMDADMLFKEPVLPSALGVKKGLAVGGHYQYLAAGIDPKIASHFVPDKKLKSLARIGGWVVMHREDLRRAAPLWLEYTKQMRNAPPEISLHIGDQYVTPQNHKAWISEMYGYVYGTAMADIEHVHNYDVMLYTGYTPSTPPKILHYGLAFDLTPNYHWTKHNFKKDMLACPGKLFKQPPSLASYKEGSKLRQLLKYENMIFTFNQLNEALVEYLEKHCEGYSFEEQKKISQQLMNGSEILAAGEICEDDHPNCSGWATDGECEKNPSYMHSNCMDSCKKCPPPTSAKDRLNRADSTSSASSPVRPDPSLRGERVIRGNDDNIRKPAISRDVNKDIAKARERMASVRPSGQELTSLRTSSIKTRSSDQSAASLGLSADDQTSRRPLIQGLKWSASILLVFGFIMGLSQTLFSSKRRKKVIESSDSASDSKGLDSASADESGSRKVARRRIRDFLNT